MKASVLRSIFPALAVFAFCIPPASGQKRLFDVDDTGPPGPGQENKGSAAPEEKAAKAPELPEAIRRQLESLEDVERDIRAKYEATVAAGRKEVAAILLKQPPDISAADSAVQTRLAERVVSEGPPAVDIRYDLARISGEWDWDYGRFMMLLPDGRFRYHEKVNGSWEWLDFSRGVIALHWPGGGDLLTVFSRPTEKCYLTSLQWGHSPLKRKPRKHSQGSVNEQPSPLTTGIQNRFIALLKSEAAAKQRLDSMIKAARDAVLPALSEAAKGVSADAAAIAAREVERLKLPGGAVIGAERLSGNWSWFDNQTITFQPDGSVKMTPGGTGRWKWAGVGGTSFFVTLPGAKKCCICRISKSDPDKVYAADDTGVKMEARRVK